MEITKETSIERNNEELVSKVIDGDFTIINIETDNYHCLNDVGRIIWDSIESTSSVASICAKIMGEYEVSEDECFADLIEYLEELHGKKLITVF